LDGKPRGEPSVSDRQFALAGAWASAPAQEKPMTTKALADKVAIVTGASSGIGRATALLFAQEGAKVVVAARRNAELDTLVIEIETAGGEAVALAGNIRDEAFAVALVEIATDRFGGLDVSFNNAGTLGPMGPSQEVALADWAEALDVNLTGAFLGAKHQIPAMLKRGGGSVIFTSSFVGHTAGMPGTAAYAAGKAGMIGLIKTLAVEYGPQGIRVNAILPGGTDTPMAHQMLDSEEAWTFVRGMHALKRTSTPQEIAPSVLYLASSASGFTTGTALLVDGGVSINKT
jgi:NAD(P)-dependent dehydrogenase (short-subunit alcohol dehydrogenase family)